MEIAKIFNVEHQSNIMRNLISAYEEYPAIEAEPQGGIVMGTNRPLGLIPIGSVFKTFWIVMGRDTEGTKTIANSIVDSDYPAPELPEWINVSPQTIIAPVNVWQKVYVTISPPIDAVEGHYWFSYKSCTMADGFGACIKMGNNYDIGPAGTIPDVHLIRGCYTPSGSTRCYPNFVTQIDEGVNSDFGSAMIHNNTENEKTVTVKFLDKDHGIEYRVGNWILGGYDIVGLGFKATLYGYGIQHWQLQIYVDGTLMDMYDFEFEIINPTHGYLNCKAFVDGTEINIPVLITPGDIQATTPFWYALDPGDYHLTANYFGNIQEKDITIILTQQTDVTFQYEIRTGHLIVFTTPIEGDIYVQGELKGRGRYEAELPVSAYPISFGEVSNYIKPEDTIASVADGQTTTIEGKYVPTGPPIAGALLFLPIALGGLIMAASK